MNANVLSLMAYAVQSVVVLLYFIIHPNICFEGIKLL